MRLGFWMGALVLLAFFAASPNVLVKMVFMSDDIFFGVTRAFLSRSGLSDDHTQTLRFTGDVMLARHVETLLDKEGSDYPYRRLETATRTAWIGNFEAAVPDNHAHTPDFTFTFSVDKKHTQALRDFGFQYVSLANNHSYDYGKKGLAETRGNLDHFTAFGLPDRVSTESVAYLPLADSTVGVIGINAVTHIPTERELTDVLLTMQAQSDFQVAYIHWGDEYELVHNATQQRLAEQLIDTGVEAVIGHHPHVVQDIGMYKEKPIFYSLGNFIFDQYFDPAVQQGLVVELSVVDGSLQYELIPVTSEDKTASPREMTQMEKDVFLTELMSRSDRAFVEALQDGHITLRE